MALEEKSALELDEEVLCHGDKARQEMVLDRLHGGAFGCIAAVVV